MPSKKGLKRGREEQERNIQSKRRAAIALKNEMFGKKVRENSGVDLAFVVDCTGSMTPHLDEVKLKIRFIVDVVKRMYDNSVRIAFVGYRDYCSRRGRVVSIDFNPDTNMVIRFLNRTKAYGGGDECEDVLGGLERATTLDWSQPNKVLMHIADSPQHGSRFYQDAEDDYEDFNDVDYRGLRPENVIAKLESLKLSYFFGKIENSTDKMIQEFRKMARNDDFIKILDMKNPSSITHEIVSSVSSTIDHTLSTTFASSDEEELPILEFEPNSPQKVIWSDYYPSQGETLSLITYGHNIGVPVSEQEEVICEAQPFAVGKNRFAFRGIRVSTGEPIVIKKLKKQKPDSKRFYEPYQECLMNMDTQAVAEYLANKFNILAPKSLTSTITFLKSSVVQMTQNGQPTFFNAESVLPDSNNFKKWCSNYRFFGKCDEDEILHAFIHWTFVFTDKQLMVVDLQGVHHDGKYTLTDPAINSQTLKYGRTDLGTTGMESFFRHHECNSICSDLDLPKNDTEIVKLRSWTL